jgi:hypothetical protein
MIKIDYTHILAFLLLFMSIEYVLLITELNYYLDMTSDIQGYKFNFYKNLENNLTLKNIINLTVLYLVFTFALYYYIIQNKKSIIYGFIFATLLALMWDACLFFMFDRATKYLPLLLYDSFVVVGVCAIISQYLLYNYYPVLKKYIGFLIVLYSATMVWFLYECYKYNPDLSNIKGIVLF